MIADQPMKGAAFPNAFTVDVEDYCAVNGFETTVRRQQWDFFELRVEDGCSRILDLLAERSVRATFFFLGWVAARLPRLVRRARDEGHEVACHTYWHRVIAGTTPVQFREDVSRAKRLLEDIAGVEVVSFRAPSFSITPATAWAFEELAALGFAIDSSVCPGSRRRSGWPGAPLGPYVVETPSGALREFPATVVRQGPFGLPMGGGGYLRLFPYEATRWAIRQANAAGRPANIYVHPWELDVDQPRCEARRTSRFCHYVNLETAELKLRRLVEDFCFLPLTELLSGMERRTTRPQRARVAA